VGLAGRARAHPLSLVAGAAPSRSRAIAPRVTVIIATYNWSTVLPYSIGSVLRQTFADWELLVIGDGCSDDSAAVVRTFDDPRVQWLNLPANTGHQSGPNNEGLRRAAGELVAYLGHDDLWLPHHLALLVAEIDRGAVAAYGITELVAPGDRAVEPAPRRLDAYRPGTWIPPTGLVHRRSVALELGGWRKPGETRVDPEVDLLERIAARGGEVAFVRRLTAVKFPAAVRRDVYRERPCAEQARYFARSGEASFEAVELARLLERAERATFRTLVRRELGRLRNDAWRLLLGYRRGVLSRRRRRKGLAPAP